MDKIATERFVDPIDDCMTFCDQINDVEGYLDPEDHWDLMLSLFRLWEFVERLPEETRREIAGTPEFIADISNQMRNWAEGRDPEEEWPRHLLARLEPDTRPDVER